MTKVPASVCLNCGKRLNAAATMEDMNARPDPGDMTVCFYCGHLMAFADDLSMRELTDEEILDAGGNETILEIQKMRAAYKNLN